jgi:hypothetical protein
MTVFVREVEDLHAFIQPDRPSKALGREACTLIDILNIIHRPLSLRIISRISIIVLMYNRHELLDLNCHESLENSLRFCTFSKIYFNIILARIPMHHSIISS